MATPLNFDQDDRSLEEHSNSSFSSTESFFHFSDRVEEEDGDEESFSPPEELVPYNFEPSTGGESGEEPEADEDVRRLHTTDW